MDDLDLMTASLVASWRTLAEGAPDARVERAGEASAAIFPAGPSRAIFNNALIDRGATDPEAAVRAVAAAYADAAVDGFAIWAHAGDSATIAELEAAGCAVAESTCAMVARLGGEAGAADAASVGERAAEERATAGPAAVERLDEPGEALGLNGVGGDLFARWPAGARWFGIRDAAGALVSCALALHLDGDCQISFVATAPAARRQGHARGVLAALLADARAHGCATASLQSTPEAERLYAAAGFAEVGRFVEYARG